MDRKPKRRHYATVLILSTPQYQSIYCLMNLLLIFAYCCYDCSWQIKVYILCTRSQVKIMLIIIYFTIQTFQITLIK